MSYQVVINCCYGGFHLSNKALKWLADKGLDLDDSYPSLSALPRHHPLLVECINVLGQEASGELSNLEIVTVTGKYRIHEYDGYESIQTPESVTWIDPTVY